MSSDMFFAACFVLWGLGKAIQIANRTVNHDGAVADATKNGLVSMIGRWLR